MKAEKLVKYFLSSVSLPSNTIARDCAIVVRAVVALGAEALGTASAEDAATAVDAAGRGSSGIVSVLALGPASAVEAATAVDASAVVDASPAEVAQGVGEGAKGRPSGRHPLPPQHSFYESSLEFHVSVSLFDHAFHWPEAHARP